MKRIILTVMAVVFTSALFAHPATEIKAKFALPAKNLVLTYLHTVKDNAQHFISEVKIELNGKNIITQNLSMQDNKISGDLMFKIPEAKEGDKITIKTKCNKIGNKEYTLTIPGKADVKAVPDAGAAGVKKEPVKPKGLPVPGK